VIRALRQLAVVLALALLPALVSGALQLQWNSETPASHGEVTLATVHHWGDRVLWVDARSREKYDRAHIPGAVLLNEDEWSTLLPAFIDAWDPDVPVVVYCDGGSCDASHAIAERLREEIPQIQKLHVLKGGWSAWSGK
jgi:rhodanese-related sulfurtransferase